MSTTTSTDYYIGTRAYRSYKNGDLISDDDLHVATPILKDTAAFLRSLGPEFKFPATDLALVASQFEDFARFRARTR